MAKAHCTLGIYHLDLKSLLKISGHRKLFKNLNYAKLLYALWIWMQTDGMKLRGIMLMMMDLRSPSRKGRRCMKLFGVAL